MKSKYKKIISLSIMLVFLVGYFILIEQDKDRRVQKNIIDFQSEYKDFIDKEYVFDNKLLTTVAGVALKDIDLSKFYKDMRSSTLKNIETTLLDEIYIFNFLKSENTQYYDQVNKSKYEELVKKAENLLKEDRSKNKLETIKELDSYNKQLKQIVYLELEASKELLAFFDDAMNNKNTTSDLINNCFSVQSNSQWQLDYEASKEYCKALGLSDCNKYIKQNTSHKFVGYTLNNPSAVLDNEHYYLDYVSFNNDDYRKENVERFELIKDKRDIYPEVYVSTYNNKKIYKYNVIALKKNTKLSCNKPK